MHNFLGPIASSSTYPSVGQSVSGSVIDSFRLEISIASPSFEWNRCYYGEVWLTEFSSRTPLMWFIALLHPPLWSAIASNMPNYQLIKSSSFFQFHLPRVWNPPFKLQNWFSWQSLSLTINHANRYYKYLLISYVLYHSSCYHSLLEHVFTLPSNCPLIKSHSPLNKWKK